MALSKEAGVEKVQVRARGRWLEEQHRTYLQEHGGDTEPPSVEEVARQIRLPSRAQVEAGDWVDPAKRWVEVAPSAGWGWARDLLPQEEEVRGPGWRPPTPPKPDRSLLGRAVNEPSQSFTVYSLLTAPVGYDLCIGVPI